MRTIALALTCALTLSFTPLSTGCGAAGIGAAIAKAVQVVATITGLIDAVDDQVRSQAGAGQLPADWAAQVARVRHAADALSDAADRGPTAWNIAVAEFQRVWASFTDAAAPFGVVAGEPERGRLSASREHVLLVASSDALGARLRGEQ